MPNRTDQDTPRWNTTELITALVTVVAFVVCVAVVAWGSMLRLFATIGVLVTLGMIEHLSHRDTGWPPPTPSARVEVS